MSSSAPLQTRARKADLLFFITLGFMLHKLLSKVLLLQTSHMDSSSAPVPGALFSFAWLSPDVQSDSTASVDA